jgi:hypothetical protein
MRERIRLVLNQKPLRDFLHFDDEVLEGVSLGQQ